MSQLEEFRRRTTSLRQANEELLLSITVLLGYERRGNTTFVELQSGLRRFGEAAQTATAALKSLCEILAVDPDGLDGELDDLVPPILEGDFDEHP